MFWLILRLGIANKKQLNDFTKYFLANFQLLTVFSAILLITLTFNGVFTRLTTFLVVYNYF